MRRLRLSLALVVVALLAFLFSCVSIEPYPTDYDADQRRTMDFAHALATGAIP